MTNMKKFLVVFLVFAATSTNAYELATHAAITYNAYLKSNLNPGGQVVQDLGILNFIMNIDNSNKPFGEFYYDIQGAAINVRSAQDFEENIIVPIPGIDISPLTLSGWLMRGAIREDDGGYLAGFKKIGTTGEPYDDPYGNINRWCNHFFDPLNNSAATFYCPAPGPESAVNWAIGTTDAFASSVVENTGRRNHFAIFDAREVMYRAITGQSKDGANLGGTLPASEVDRKRYWATLFRALGDIAHLNQDMAQPQHTRDESHAGILSGIGFNLRGNPIYEKYIDAHAKGATDFPIDGTAGVIVQPLAYCCYTIPTFGKYSDFWSTGTGDSSLSGRGLADYTNHGFFTIDNSIGGTKYTHPSPIAATYLTQPTMYPPGLSTQFIMNYLIGPVDDSNTGGIDSIRMVRETAWKDFSTAGPVYTMDRNNFDDMAALLIPRAVSYSAGIINYFFRGKMQISLPDEGVYAVIDHSTVSVPNTPSDKLNNFTGFNAIKLKLSAPATDNNNQAQALSGGKLVAVLKFRRNICYLDDLSNYPSSDAAEAICHTDVDEIVVSDPANGGNAMALSATPIPITFTFPRALPINATDVRLQVVYRGTLGTETDAVVVATQDISEPTFVSYMNATDYNAIQGKVYTRNDISNNQALLALVPCAYGTPGALQLGPNCLIAYNISVGLTLGSGATQVKLAINALPPKSFVRLAILGGASAATSLAQMDTNTCYPHDALSVDPLVWQDDYDPAANQITDTWVDTLSTVRGVSQWVGSSCVTNADNSVPGSPDNRDTAMTSTGVSTTPTAILINGGSSFPTVTP